MPISEPPAHSNYPQQFHTRTLATMNAKRLTRSGNGHAEPTPRPAHAPQLMLDQ